LKLNAILGHRSAPYGWTRGQCAPAGGSKREPAESHG
jgi:hypothetical protein